MSDARHRHAHALTSNLNETFCYNEPSFTRDVAALKRVAAPIGEVEQTVRGIISEVRQRGDDALIEFTHKFGGPLLSSSELRETNMLSVDATTQEAIAIAHANVRSFAERGLRKDWEMRNAQGARIGERFTPFQRVGIYVPGGTAPLVSSAIMTVTLAAVAGVPEIVVTTPAGADGKIHAALCYALSYAGATEIYRVGGAQAIAALAYGTPTIRRVLKVFGPGNAYVVEAKRQVFGTVSVDLLPGPSEILYLADETGNPAWIAADLLAQAEHGKGSAIVFLTDSASLLQSVTNQLTTQAQRLTRQQHLAQVIENDCALLLVETMQDALSIANQFAPEHLSIVARDAKELAAGSRTSGAIFLGGHSPVVAGDFIAGPSHELPTGGAGHSFSGLTVDQFQRRTSIVEFDEPALRKSALTIKALSALEGLDAHARSVAIRFEDPQRVDR